MQHNVSPFLTAAYDVEILRRDKDSFFFECSIETIDFIVSIDRAPADAGRLLRRSAESALAVN
jgi:hypothetical protein